MSFIQYVKSLGIRVTDKLNAWHDPFPLFDRPVLPKENKKLFEFERQFFEDLMGNFWVCGNRVIAHRLPLPLGSPLDTGDQALWHGIFTGMLALKYYQCSPIDPAMKLRLLDYLNQAAVGLNLHMTAHKESKPRLIRGVSNDLKSWQDDASNDTASGFLFGVYGLYKWGPPSLQKVCQDLITWLADELLSNGHALILADGSPTTYGELIQGWKTDPLRLTLCLAIYRTAFGITGALKYAQSFGQLYRQYEPLINYPKVKLWWIENYGDTHRGAIHLAILADWEAAGYPYTRDIYEGGLYRISHMVEKEGNIWVNALCAFGAHLPIYTDQYRDIALKVLSEFTLTDKQYNPGRDNSANSITIHYGENNTQWTYRMILWNGTYMADQPLPRWAVRSQDFFWQRNLRSLDVGSDGAPADSRLNCGDWLCAYWLSRKTKILNEND